MTDIFQEMLVNGQVIFQEMKLVNEVSEISRQLIALQGTDQPVRTQNQWKNHTFQEKHS